jgi:DNA-binding response OmpR family regulator
MTDRPVVLIVDDEGMYSRVIAEVLQRRGFRARTAAHGLGALFSAKRDLPDLILLDVMMPEMDGLTAVRKIRADADLARIPVVVCSALCSTSDRQAALAAGADAYLVKPFTVEELTDALDPLLARGSQRERLRAGQGTDALSGGLARS